MKLFTSLSIFSFITLTNALFINRVQDGLSSLSKISSQQNLLDSESRSRNLLDTSDPLVLCAVNSANLGGFDFLGEFEIDSNCDESIYTCDFANTDEAAALKEACNSAGGEIFTSDFGYCAADLGIAKDLILKNLPLCLSPSCPEDTSFTDIFGVFLDVLDELFDDDTVAAVFNSPTFRGECTPDNVIPHSPSASPITSPTTPDNLAFTSTANNAGIVFVSLLLFGSYLSL